MATQLVPGPHDSGGPSTSFSSPPSSHPPRAGTSTPHSRSSSPRSFYRPSPDSPTGGSSPTHSASSTPRGSWKRERVLSTKRLPGEAFSPWPGVVEGGEDGLGSPLGSTSRPRTSESVRANSRASKKKEAEDIKVAPWLSADLGAFQVSLPLTYTFRSFSGDSRPPQDDVHVLTERHRPPFSPRLKRMCRRIGRVSPPSLPLTHQRPHLMSPATPARRPSRPPAPRLSDPK